MEKFIYLMVSTRYMIRLNPGEERYANTLWTQGNFLVKVTNLKCWAPIYYITQNDNLVSSIHELAERLIPSAGEDPNTIEEKLKIINPNVKLNYQIGRGENRIIVDILDLGRLGEIRHSSNKKGMSFSEINADNLESYHKIRLTNEIFERYIMNPAGDVTYVPGDKAVISILKNAKHLFNVYSVVPLNSMIVKMNSKSDIIGIARKTKETGWYDNWNNNSFCTYGENLIMPISDRHMSLYHSHIPHMKEYPNISAQFFPLFYFKRKSVIVDPNEESFYWGIVEDAVKNCTSVATHGYLNDIPNGMTRKKSEETNDWNPTKEEFLKVAKDHLMIK
jgi:hypothetical protein